jgi:predicted ATP-binding protein involved in virulence
LDNSKKSSQLIVTTHSPYVLTSINNLIQASIVSNSVSEEKKLAVYKIVPKELMISEKYLNAYAFKDGTAVNIVDKETGLIYSKYLDSVSEEISIEFDKLLNIE